MDKIAELTDMVNFTHKRIADLEMQLQQLYDLRDIYNDRLIVAMQEVDK